MAKDLDFEAEKNQISYLTTYGSQFMYYHENSEKFNLKLDLLKHIMVSKFDLV